MSLVLDCGTEEGDLMSDFRSDRMPSPDGRGNARKKFADAWGAYVAFLQPANDLLKPALEKIAMPVARSLTFDMLGFWLAWQLEGGFEGLMRPKPKGLGMSRSAVYRRIAMFRRMTGKHPDEYTIPGVTLDVAAYWANVIKEAKRDTPS
jgi:hypothetical protein